MPYDSKEVAERWNDTAEAFVSGKYQGLYWWDAGPEINARINSNISGDPSLDYTKYTLREYFSKKVPLERCLSLGCGLGGLERSLARQNAFQSCDAYDVSEGSIKEARKMAEDEGFCNIRYMVADINKIELPPKTYDAVWIQGAMHHFEALEHVCQQIKATLKPGGLLILNEYVGASRFQFSARQIEIANLCLQLLPSKYRHIQQNAAENHFIRSDSSGIKWFVSRLMDKIRDGSLIDVIKRRIRSYKIRVTGQQIEKVTIPFPSARDVIAADPSEAIRSGEIVKVLEQYFEILEKKDLGGNILQFLLADIAGNFTENTKESQGLLKMLIEIEETMLLCGEFSSDFAYIVCRP